MTDVVDRCRTGDSDAYAALYRRWFPRCRSVALKVLADVGAEDEADDIAQEALVLAWARLDQLRDSASFGSWVSRITYNVALGSVRRHRPDTQPLEALNDEHEALVTEDADPQDVVVGRERDRLVRVAAGSLAGREEEAFGRVVDDGMTPAEVARALNVSDNHAYQILFRLRGRMQWGMRAALVWRQGRPRCSELARLVGERRTVTDDAFTPQTASLVVRHLRRCPACTQEADVHAGPHHLLSGVMAGLLTRAPSWLARSRAADTVVAATAGDVTVKVAACVGIATSITAGVITFSGLPAPHSHPDRQGTRAAPAGGVRVLPAVDGASERTAAPHTVVSGHRPCQTARAAVHSAAPTAPLAAPNPPTPLAAFAALPPSAAAPAPLLPAPLLQTPASASGQEPAAGSVPVLAPDPCSQEQDAGVSPTPITPPQGASSLSSPMLDGPTVIAPPTAPTAPTAGTLRRLPARSETELFGPFGAAAPPSIPPSSPPARMQATREDVPRVSEDDQRNDRPDLAAPGGFGH